MVVLAFNSVGYRPTNVLFNTINTFIGYDADKHFDDRESRAGAFAYIKDSDLTVAGDLNVFAFNDVSTDHTIGNENTSSPNKLGSKGAKGTRVGVRVASVMAASEAKAWIEESGNTREISADGVVEVKALENSEFIASANVEAAFVAGSDKGASLMNKAIGDLVDQYRFTSLSGTQIVERGTVVRNVDDGQNYMFRGDMEDLVGSVLEPTNTAAAIAAGAWARASYTPSTTTRKITAP